MVITNSAGIVASGSFFPKKIITVQKLAEDHKLDFSKINEDHSVESIHVASKKEDEYYMASKAAEKAMRNARVSPKDLDVVIYCKGISIQKNPRSVASRLIQHLKAPHAFGFDVDAGFLGGMAALQVASDMLKSNPRLEYALIVAAQDFDELYLMGKTARVKNMIFGDGAAALVLKQDHMENKILSTYYRTDHVTSLIDQVFEKHISQPSLLKKLVAPLHTGPVIRRIMQPRHTAQLTKRWVHNAYQSLAYAIRSVNMDVSDINHIVKTQLSYQETEQFAETMQLNPAKILTHGPTTGHLGHADILLNIHSLLNNKNLHRLDIIALVTINYDCSAGCLILRR